MLRASRPATAGAVALSPSALAGGLLASLISFRGFRKGCGTQDYDLVAGAEFVSLCKRGAEVRVRGHQRTLFRIATYNAEFHPPSFVISQGSVLDMAFRQKSP